MAQAGVSPVGPLDWPGGALYGTRVECTRNPPALLVILMLIDLSMLGSTLVFVCVPTWLPSGSCHGRQE
jgi:hypothetical protein